MTLLQTVHLPLVMMVRRRVKLGTCVQTGYFRDGNLSQLLSYYNVITPECAGGYWYVYGGKDFPAYGWGEMDAIYQYAIDHGKRLVSYPLRWWWPGADVQPLDITAWITESMERYPLIVDWQIVNEGYWDGVETIPGIAESYQIARAVRPDVRLWYNGLFIQTAEGEEVLRLIDDGLVDGVGIQCHHDLTSYMGRYIPFICELNRRSIPWRVSELDVEIPAMDETCLRLQAGQYRDALEVLTEYGGDELGMWGIADKFSWLPGYPLPFDSNYNPKPAWAILTGD